MWRGSGTIEGNLIHEWVIVECVDFGACVG